METFDLEPGGEGTPDDPASSPLRLLLYGIVAVVLIGLGSLLIAHDTDTPDQRFTGVPTPPAPTSPIASQAVLLEDVCPVHTDHRNYLTVSFKLKNVRRTSLIVTALAGHPPIGGVKQARRTLSGGSCRIPGRDNVKSLIRPGKSELYTVRWNLPDTCPEPYPLQVRVTYQVPPQATMDSDFVTVLVDLSGIGFIQCPKVVTDFATPLSNG